MTPRVRIADVTAAGTDLMMRIAGQTPFAASVRAGIEVERRARRVFEGRVTVSRDAWRPAINYHRCGAGPPLLLLNGWTASGALWPARWVDRLAADFEIIRPDNRGSGWSRSAPRPFSMADLADDARDVLRHCGIERARVVGLSMGGMIAQELTLRHPELVENLILVATRPPAPAAIPSNSRLLLASLRGPRRDQPLDAYFSAIWTRFAAPGFSTREPDLMAEVVTQIVRRPTPRQGLLDQSRAMAGWGGAHRLRRIDVRTDILHGDQDPLIPLGNGHRLAELIPGATLHVLPGVGHLVPQEAGDVLAELIACRPSCEVKWRSPSSRG